MQDFSVAERFGQHAVQDTFNRAFKEWRGNYVYLTELVLVLNWKIWYWFERDQVIAKHYDTLWRKADAWALNHLKGDELAYYYQTLD